MYVITPWLATHGLGETSYPIVNEMQMIQDRGYLAETPYWIVDVRDMLDEPQSLDTYMQTISRAVGWKRAKEKIVICCGAGQSRSNAIAIGVLIEVCKMNFYEAHDLVRDKVPIAQIEPCHISALKKLYNVTLP